MSDWDVLTAQERRNQFAHEFRNFDLVQHEVFLRRRRTRASTKAWHLQAVKLAKSGRYYMRELTPLLEKSPEAVSMMFTRLRALKGVAGSGWPVVKTPTEGKRLVVANGKWRLEDGLADVGHDPLHNGELHTGGEGTSPSAPQCHGSSVPRDGFQLEQATGVCVLRRAEWRVLRESLAASQAGRDDARLFPGA